MHKRLGGRRQAWAAIWTVALLATAGCSFNTKQSSGSGGVGLDSGSGGTGGGMGGGGSSGTGGGRSVTGLTISPSTATLMVTSGGPAQTQQYTVTGTVNGQRRI